jgi:hypothetical protein
VETCAQESAFFLLFLRLADVVAAALGDIKGVWKNRAKAGERRFMPRTAGLVGGDR